MYNDKYIRTKIELYGDTVNANFHGKKIPKENAHSTCLSVILLDSVVRAGKNYYRQRLLEECKYEIKENEMKNLTNDDLDLNSSDGNESDDESGDESDDESSDESSDKKMSKDFINQQQKILRY